MTAPVPAPDRDRETCPHGWRDARCGRFGERGPCGCEPPGQPMSADRDRETRLAEAREEIIEALAAAEAEHVIRHGEVCSCGWEVSHDEPGWLLAAMEHRLLTNADAVLALPALRAVRDLDTLRRDLAALAEEWDGSHDWTDAAARLWVLLDGGEGGR